MISVGEMPLPSRLLHYEETKAFVERELELVSVYDGASLSSTNALLCLPEHPKEDEEHRKYTLLMLVNPKKAKEIAVLCENPDRETIAINRIRKGELEVMVTKPESAHHYELLEFQNNPYKIILREVDPLVTYQRMMGKIAEIKNPHPPRQSVSVFDSKHVYPLQVSERKKYFR